MKTRARLVSTKSRVWRWRTFAFGMLALCNFVDRVDAATPFEVSQQVEKKIAGIEKRVESALEMTAREASLPAVDKLSGELVKCREELKGAKGVESEINTAISALDKILRDSGITDKNLADLSAQATSIKKKLEEFKSKLMALATRLEDLNKQTNEWRKIYKLQVAMIGQAGAGEKIKSAAKAELQQWRDKMMYAKPSNEAAQNTVPPTYGTPTNAMSAPTATIDNSASQTDVEFAVIKKMVLTQLDADNRGDVALVMSLYADYVDFLDEGLRSRAEIAFDLPAYYSHWPNRRASLVGEIRIQAFGRNERIVMFSIDFFAENPIKQEKRASKVDVVWHLRRKSRASEFKIVSQKQKSTPQPLGAGSLSEPILPQMS